MCRGEGTRSGGIRRFRAGKGVSRVISSSVRVHVMEPMWVLPASVGQPAAQQCGCACDRRSHQSGGSPDSDACG